MQASVSQVKATDHGVSCLQYSRMSVRALTHHWGAFLIWPASTHLWPSCQAGRVSLICYNMCNITGMCLQMLVMKPYELWWPVGYGNQTMYTFTIELIPDDTTSAGNSSSSCHEAAPQQDADSCMDGQSKGCLNPPQYSRDPLSSHPGDKCWDAAPGAKSDMAACHVGLESEQQRSGYIQESFSHHSQRVHEHEHQGTSCLPNAALCGEMNRRSTAQQRSRCFPHSADHGNDGCSSTSKPSMDAAGHCPPGSSGDAAQQDDCCLQDQAGPGQAQSGASTPGPHWGGEHAMVLQRRIGLREVELRRKKLPDGETFGFVVNGVPVYAKGELPDMLLCSVHGAQCSLLCAFCKCACAPVCKAIVVEIVRAIGEAQPSAES